MRKTISKDLPQLIVGLDSLDDAANYIHIDDAKEGYTYYCPCCRGIIKPRAYKKEVNYRVQPHFYHESGGCSEESYVHYICKNWLFNHGCKFIVNDTQYEVDKIDVEKTLHTSFGDYRPDIIVTTTIGKVFYFEIKVSNRKSELYAPKWDELGNDVVEVDIKYFINQKYANDIPVFDLIYSDGECFINTYSNKKYEKISKRKLEWKRQDKLNYKIQWERLDWFWFALSEYIAGNGTEQDVIAKFTDLDYQDKIWCFYEIKNKSCVNLKDEFREIINQYFFDEVKKIEDKYDIGIFDLQASLYVYEFDCIKLYKYLDYNLIDETKVKIKVSKGSILLSDNLKEIEEAAISLQKSEAEYNKWLEESLKINDLPYVKSFAPVSHYQAEAYPISFLMFRAVFEDYIHSTSIKEFMGECLTVFGDFDRVKEEYRLLKNDALDDLDREMFHHAIRNNSKLQKTIKCIDSMCKNSGVEGLRIRAKDRIIILLNSFTSICEWKLENEFTGFEEDLLELFTKEIDNQIAVDRDVKKYIEMIQSCKNGLWGINYRNGDITLYLYDENGREIDRMIIMDISMSNDVKTEITNTMQNMMNYVEKNKGVRFLEVK